MTRRYARPLRDMPYMSTTKQRAHEVGITARDLSNLAIGAAVLAGLAVLNPLLAVWAMLKGD